MPATVVAHNEELNFNVRSTQVRVRFHDNFGGETGTHKINVNLSGDFSGAFGMIGDETCYSERRKAVQAMMQAYVEELYHRKKGEST